jgi:hypothetical protein
MSIQLKMMPSISADILTTPTAAGSCKRRQLEIVGIVVGASGTLKVVGKWEEALV